MSFKVFPIDHTSKYLDDVIDLGDANKKKLGLFPKDAYKEHASKKWILVAVDELNNELAGYLLYNLSRRKMLASIVHLCVDSSWRKNGISRLLFNKLVELTKDGYLGIRVHCRIDYEANKVWPKLGFVAVGEIDGRGKSGTRLNVWRFEFDHPNLFSYALQEIDSPKTKVVIDANVFFQLLYPEEPGSEESQPLLEPWLDIDLYITPELLNEINRNPDKDKRDMARRFSTAFTKVESKSSQKEFKEVRSELLKSFPPIKNPSDESDINQLTYAITARLPFFVTRDGAMLDRAEEIFERFDIQVLRPADVILMQDELMRGADYSPSRLAGSQIRIEKVHSQQSENLVNKFLSDQDEKKSNFNRKVQLALSNTSITDTFVVIDAQGKEYGLISYSRGKDNQLEVPIFRVGRDAICQVIAKYLVNEVILIASSEGRNTIKISDEYLQRYVVSALQESGFFQSQNIWFKITIPGILSVADLLERLSDSSWPRYTKKALGKLSSLLKESPSVELLLEIEKSLWPLKITDLDIPTFIVPIKPEWAMHLFDVETATQDLFGGEPFLILNAENVYYRSSRPKVISSPSRVLWYVSSGNRHYQGAMHLKACSYVDEVMIGKPKSVYSRYKKLGIYKWRDVYNGIAKNDLNKEIMAFKFSKTEVLDHPIHFSDLKNIWIFYGQNFNIIAPLLINQERFFELYRKGTKGK